MPTFRKDPSATLDYAFDWSVWLTGGDAIASYTLTLPEGLVLESSTSTSTVITAWISGGTAGTYYTVSCRVITVLGREEERSLTLACEDR